MSPGEEYRVRLEVFEGPLDLLLYLIKKNEVDIYDIPIERITQQYLEYLDLMRMLDLNIAGDFIVMAATLMMIKSRMLLPPEERPELEEEEEDPRWELVRQLVEYKKFKDAALHLEGLEQERLGVFAREGEPVVQGPAVEIPLRDVSLFDLISAFGEVLKRLRQEAMPELVAERITVAEKMQEILERLSGAEKLEFRELFGEWVTRYELVCAFLALLELIRLGQVIARQERPFGEIFLLRPQAVRS